MFPLHSGSYTHSHTITKHAGSTLSVGNKKTGLQIPDLLSIFPHPLTLSSQEVPGLSVGNNIDFHNPAKQIEVPTPSVGNAPNVPPPSVGTNI
mmetsp:Transcript_11351/g.20464  ORF Transcript_11351/g.20464 Transcript_11351/m.20464 type:complete len:93 (+) Transcript_11351:507-785(+)